MNKDTKYNEENIKAIYDLYSNYCFALNEIKKILNGETIYEVLASKIYNLLIQIQRECEKYNDVGTEHDETTFDKEEIKNILIEDKQKMVNIIKKYTEQLNKENNIDLIKKIDKVLDIISRLEEILGKYEGKFKEPKVNYNEIIFDNLIDEELFYKVQIKK